MAETAAGRAIGGGLTRLAETGAGRFGSKAWSKANGPIEELFARGGSEATESLAAKVGAETVGEIESATTFYHGTTKEFAANIRSNGIDLSKGRANLDFGQGFYTSRSYEHAAERAAQMTDRFGGAPSVLEFRVPNSELNKLKTLSFSEPDSAWAAFIKGNRTGAASHGFDSVSGPTWRRFSSGGEAMSWPFPQFNQTSFHTEQPVNLLMKGLQ